MLHLFNTMGRKIEDFVPITEGFVGFYGCGPTVYNYAHIGNLRAYVFLDILDRSLTFLGFKKKHVMNITDIGHLSGDSDSGEDKMLKTALEKQSSVMEIANFYTKAFFDDMKHLNIIKPDVVCKATEHIDCMIDLIKRIEGNKHTYKAGGNLYFDTSTIKDYGKLTKVLETNAPQISRVALDTNKRHPKDFVLWFTKSKYQEQALIWDSPWGVGYPGWHIECSAMSMKYLGEHFDIHTGGIDHIPIHHTNEIAQSEAATNHKWVNYWLHNEFLVIKGKDEDAKMSKSQGNFLTLNDLLEKGYDALDYRFFLLGAHYRSQIAFSFLALDGAKNARLALCKRIAKIIATNKSATSNNYTQDVNKYMVDFTSSIEDDLSTPKALGVLQSIVKDTSLSPASVLEAIKKMDSVLGLKLEETAMQLLQKENSIVINTNATLSQNEIESLIQKRLNAKQNKDFALADKIRAELAAQGVVLTDTKTGTTWSYK